MDKYFIDRQSTVLMIIDIQNRLLPVIYNKDEIIKNTNILIEACKELNIPYIVTEQYPKGLGKTTEELNLDISSIDIYEKLSFSAYTEEVEEKLNLLEKKKIIVVGMETHICVYQTVRDLIKNGYDVHLVSDAVGSRFKLNDDNGKKLIHDLGGVLTNTETVLFDLLKVAKTEEFKKISKLIK